MVSAATKGLVHGTETSTETAPGLSLDGLLGLNDQEHDGRSNFHRQLAFLVALLPTFSSCLSWAFIESSPCLVLVLNTMLFSCTMLLTIA